MRFSKFASIMCGVVVALHSLGATDTNIAGTWRWSFTMPDGTKVTPALSLAQEDGAWRGTTWFRGGQRSTVTNLVVKDNHVSYDVVRERDGRPMVTRYAGEIAGEILRGKISSDWSGSPQTYDWSAKRDNGVDGTWKWSTGGGGFRGDYTAKFKTEQGKLTGKVNSTRSEYDVKNGRVNDGEVSFETERERDGVKSTTRYLGSVTGDKIVGTTAFEFGGTPRTNTWEAVRVE